MFDQLEHSQYPHDSHQSQQFPRATNHQSILIKMNYVSADIQSINLESLQDKVEKIGNDGQDVNNVQRTLDELPF